MKVSTIVLFSFLVLANFAMISCDSASSLDEAENADGDSNNPSGCECPFGCDEQGNCLESTTCVENTDCPPGMICEQGVCITPGMDDDDDDDSIKPDDDDDSISDDDDDSFTDDDDDSVDPFDAIDDIVFETEIPHEEANPWILVEPTEIDFGAVPLLNTREKMVTVSNIGNADLVIDEIYLYFERNDTVVELVVANNNLPITLPQGQEATVSIFYTPYDLDPDIDMLIIGSNDPSEPNVGVKIFTEVKEVTELFVDPSEIAFGTVRLGRYTEQIRMRNMSSLDLRVFELLLDPPISEISVEGIPEGITTDSPYSFSPFEELVLTVVYEPTVPDGEMDNAHITILSNAERNSSLVIPISGTPCEPEIDVIPNAMDFSQVAPEMTETKCSTVTNLGCWELEITDIEMTDDGGGAYVWDPQPVESVTLSEGESIQLCVAHTPSPDGDNDGNIRLLTNDTSEPEVNIRLSGEELPGDIECTPPEMNFAPLPDGETSGQTAICRNVGAGTLTIERIDVFSQQIGVFTMIGAPQLGPLAPGEQILIPIMYEPTDVDPDNGMIDVTSDDPDQNVVQIPISGEGRLPNHCPVAVIDVLSPAIEDIQQGGLVSLSGTSSYDSDIDDAVTWYVWSIDEKPVGSASVLSSNTAPQPTITPDLPGTYVIRLEVRDTKNELSCIPATLTFEVPFGEIDCVPTSLNFTALDAGLFADQTVTCTNVGDGILNIDRIELFAAAPSPYAIQGAAPTGDLGPNESAQITVRYQPSQPAADSGTLEVGNNDIDENPVVIPITGGGVIPNNCPIAVISVTSPPVGSIIVGDTVVLDGSSSSDPDNGDAIATYIWSIDAKPSGSTAALSSTSIPSPTIVVDKEGDYRIKLEVRDSDGELSCSPAFVTFHAGPSLPMSGDPAAIGHFLNVITAQPIQGVYWQMQSGGQTVATSVNSDYNGDAVINGSYPVTTYIGHVPSGQGALGSYVCPDVQFSLIVNGTAHVYFSCQPPLPSGALRIVLHWTNWEQGGADLDAHLYVPDHWLFGDRHLHVYYGNRSAGDAQLDHDGGVQAGSPEPSPETTTINSLTNDGSGIYCYSIHDYDRASGPWRGRNAYVDVFDSNGLYATFPGPAYGASGGWWHVFRINGNNGTITMIDSMDTGSPSCP